MGQDIEELQRLIAVGLQAGREEPVLDALTSSLRRFGVPLRRVVAASDVLHPLFGARGILWTPEGGITIEDFKRGSDDTEDWLRSPFQFMIQNDLKELRLRLDDTFETGRFPLLDRLRGKGATDYFALMTRFGPNSTLGELDGLIWSFATHAAEGFTEHHLDLIRLLQPAASLALKTVNANATGRTLMATYLGQDAGLRVVSGAIDRGATESVTAALWFSDLENFTRLADSLPQDQVIALLNDYADCIVTVIHEHRGQVLKFMGDGILAMFPFSTDGSACLSALDAAAALQPAIARLNRKRREKELPTTQVFLGLHVGEVLYGNIGSRDRLDFTVVGPAVNEVARIEQMSRSIGQNVAVSEEFTDIADGERSRLISLGRFMLKGVGRPQELFTLDPATIAEPAEPQDATADALVT